MPPKVKFQKEEIIEAAVHIAREKGINAVTAREVGAALGVSSRPLFTYFDSVEELKREVYHYAKKLYQDYVKEGLTAEIPFLGVGQNYIRFAKEEPELYKYLFLTAPDGIRGSAIDGLKLSQELVRESLMRIYHMDGETADKYFRDLWLVAYSIATLIVTGDCPYSDEEISALFTEFSVSICKAYKEIPGLPDGRFDKDAVFRELVKQRDGGITMTTKRLILRRWEENDAEDLYQYAKDPEVGPAAGWKPHESVDESREIIKNVLNGPEAYAVCLKENGKPIGAIELMLEGSLVNELQNADECELGYWIAKPFWGQGLIPEAAREMLRHAFEDLGMNKVWCGYYDGNEKSKRVQEKVGFRYQCTKDEVLVPAFNETRTEHISCITKEEWENEL